MLENTSEILKKIKKETNNLNDIVYRSKKINDTNIYILYNEPLVSSDKISNFIMRSLNNIKEISISKLENDITNFKVTRFETYEDLCLYLHRGFTIILIQNEKVGLALETKAEISRGISAPDTESTIRGSKDSFVEDYQKNIGLIKKRIKDNNLWIDNLMLGKYTKTQIGIVYVNGIVKKELVKLVLEKLKVINIYGIIDSNMLVNLFEENNKSALPTVITTERPDMVSNELLEGKIAVVVDNSPFVILIPAVLNDFFKTSEDMYGKSLNVTLTRFIKVIAFWISLLTPAVYVSLMTFNLETLPTDILVEFAKQRENVPFPAFFEAFVMMIAFEILRESDLRVPTFIGSSLSIVGALILGDAAVNAGIVSPIMIIVISLTAISSLPFTEANLINGLRIYRIIFLIGGSFLGLFGVLLVFIFFITNLVSTESFGKPYLMPYVPTDIVGLKDSLFNFSLSKRNKRVNYLSDNKIKVRKK